MSSHLADGNVFDPTSLDAVDPKGNMTAFLLEYFALSKIHLLHVTFTMS